MCGSPVEHRCRTLPTKSRVTNTPGDLCRASVENPQTKSRNLRHKGGMGGSKINKMFVAHEGEAHVVSASQIKPSVLEPKLITNNRFNVKRN